MKRHANMSKWQRGEGGGVDGTAHCGEALGTHDC